MAEYKRGSMDVSTHQKTYGGFLRISAWVVWFVLFILVFLALFNS
ncbi:MAG: aa3-type cytochrome c oxidase subunit IV [Rhodobacteraceae bacterium]|nr:aa3-type cytochrome c oxidase subunit IV [Paracoccaceae bacterium]